jgi:phosphorylcholine metabolism protein LicD
MAKITPSYAALSANIKDAKEIADELGITIILDCGALLGAYREGGPIKNDMDDVDFAVPYKVVQYQLLTLLQAFAKRGFTLHRLRDTVATFKRDGVKIDFLFFKKDYKADQYYLTLYHNKKPYALLTNALSYEVLGTIEFCGTKLKCPLDVEVHLEQRYGDWRTPILRPAFTFQNYIDRGVMIPLHDT